MNKFIIVVASCCWLAACAAESEPSIGTETQALGTFGTETKLSIAANSWEPFIAADPHSNYVYALYFRLSGPTACPGGPSSAIILRISSDNGATWGPETGFDCTGGTGQYDPTIKVVPTTGAVYATYMVGNSIYFRKSTDHGTTWSAPLKVSGKAWADHPWFGMSDNGNDVYVFWAHGDMLGVASHNAGASFSSQVKVNSDSGRQYYAEGVEVLSDGTVLVTGLSYPCGANGKGISQCAGTANVTVLRSTNGGTSYTQNNLDAVQTGPQWLTFPLESIAKDATDRVVTIFNGAATTGANDQTFVRVSTDHGVTWGPRVELTPGAGADSCYPAVVGTGTGSFRATYMDNRLSGAFDVWYRESSDGGATWSSDVRLSNATSGAAYKTTNGFGAPYGDYQAVTVTTAGKTLAIWGEGPVGQAAPGDIWMNAQQ